MLTIKDISNINKDNELMNTGGSVEDPSSHINQLHNYVDILLAGIISVICEAETLKQMINLLTQKKDFLGSFLTSH